MDVTKQDILRDERGHYLPGCSGNPEGGGRPVGSISLVTQLRQYLTAHPDEAYKVIEGLVKQGKLGNILATKEMFERIDGKVPERHRIDFENQVKIIFVPSSETYIAGAPVEPALAESLTTNETLMIAEAIQPTGEN